MPGSRAHGCCPTTIRELKRSLTSTTADHQPLGLAAQHAPARRRRQGRSSSLRCGRSTLTPPAARRAPPPTSRRFHQQQHRTRLTPRPLTESAPSGMMPRPLTESAPSRMTTSSRHAPRVTPPPPISPPLAGNRRLVGEDPDGELQVNRSPAQVGVGSPGGSSSGSPSCLFGRLEGRPDLS